MFDFADVKTAIIDDIKPICTQNYLILKELNVFPMEINLIIIYNRLIHSNELIMLKEDIEYSYKDSMFRLIQQSITTSMLCGTDILSNYDEYLKDLPDRHYWGKTSHIYNPKSECYYSRCTDILYLLNDNIFYTLLLDYINKTNILYKDYEKHYNLNTDYYIKIMNLKSDMKYIKLLQIVNLDNFLEFS